MVNSTAFGRTDAIRSSRRSSTGVASSSSMTWWMVWSGKPAAASGSVVVLSGVAAAQPVTRSRVVARSTPRLVFDARGMAGFTFVEGCVGARTRAMRLPANSPGGPHSRSTD
ncbi:GspH/FimT family pseudopilin [Microbacterium lacticum]